MLLSPILTNVNLYVRKPRIVSLIIVRCVFDGNYELIVDKLNCY